MSENLKDYFKVNPKAFYINSEGKTCKRGVDYKDDSLRRDEAKEQAKDSPVPYSKVFSYVNDLLEKIRLDNGYTKKITRCEWIKLDEKQHVILDNGIIIKNCMWNSIWSNNRYSHIDKKFYDIKDEFNLEKVNDVVWVKFTNRGHVGVVGKGCDINFNYNNSCGKLLCHINEKWNESFVIVFPLTSEILHNKYTREDIELAVGQYLITKKVPIIDFYSHNY